MIVIENLKKTYVKRGRDNFILDIPKLEVNENEIVYLIGPNGSGKTTLLDIIQGQVLPDSGHIQINSFQKIDLLSTEPYKRAKYLGVVPQNSEEALVNEMNIIDHILFGLSQSKEINWFFPRIRNSKKVRKIVSQFNIGFENRLSEPVGNLSGGERQVLSFCLATLRNPNILLLDEFTASLDPQMVIQVSNLVMSYIKENKLSALIVTHQHKEAIENADRIIVLHKGKLYSEFHRNSNNFSERELKILFKQLYEKKLEII